MYVGTPDGHVLLYVIEKQKTPDGKTAFVSLIISFSPNYILRLYLHPNK